MLQVRVQDKLFAYSLRNIFESCGRSFICLLREAGKGCERSEKCQVFKFGEDLEKRAPLFLGFFQQFLERLYFNGDRDRSDNLTVKKDQSEPLGAAMTVVFGIAVFYSVNKKEIPPGLDRFLDGKKLFALLADEKCNKDFYKEIKADNRYNESNFTFRADLQTMMDEYELKEGTRDMVRFVITVFMMAVDVCQKLPDAINTEKDREALFSTVIEIMKSGKKAG